MVAPYLADIYGGVSKAVKELAQGIAEQGVSIDLVTTNANGKSKLSVPVDQWIETDGYRVRYFNCIHRYDSVLSIPLCLWLARHAASYDVIHTHSMFAPVVDFAQWICRGQKVSYVTTPHGMLEPWALSYKSSKKRIYYRTFEVPALEAASAIHVLNSQEADNVNSLGFQQTEIIHNGIHRSEFEELASEDEFYQQFPEIKGRRIILFLGRIDPKKGLDLLAPAFAKIHQQFPDTHLVIAGPDSIGFLPTVKAYFEKFSCSDAVTFTGMISGSLKYAALSAASIYVSPSYSEGFSMSILEAMAVGLPCIITEKCNFPEAADAKAAYVVETDADAISQALCKVLQQPQDSEAMGQRARELVFDQYTWHCAADKLIQIYRRICLAPTTQETLPTQTVTTSNR